MSDSDPLTAQQVSETVKANRVIRAPYYKKDHDEGVRFTDLDRGLQWGADVVPAMLGLFRVERDPRADHQDGWVGFARHWRGGTLQIAFDRFIGSRESDPILVVTSITGRAGETSIRDQDFGDVELPDEIPTEAEWEEQSKRYQAIRSDDETDGTAAVEAYVAALPGWKREVANAFDEIIQREIPAVRRAVRYHQPFYGVEERGWFASFSSFTNHVKLSFVSDSYLDPEPTSATDPNRQALNVEAGDALDEEQIASWVRQAADDPGMGW